MKDNIHFQYFYINLNQAIITNILVKDLTDKVSNGKQYIRIAVKDKDDNVTLV